MRLYDAFGESKSWGAWLKDNRCLVGSRTLRTRISAGGETFEEALSRPTGTPVLLRGFGEAKSLTEWLKDSRCEVGMSTLFTRVSRGVPLEEALLAHETPVLEIFGETKSRREWEDDGRVKVSWAEVRRRMKEGETIETSVSRPAGSPRKIDAFGESKTLREWSEDERCQAPLSVLRSRISEGKDPETALIHEVQTSSMQEVELANFIERTLPGESLLRNDKKTLGDRLELDIYLPSRSLAIEFNGLYWHSEAKKSDSNRHFKKWQACHNQGIQLLQIWEDDWLLRRPIVEAFLQNRLGASTAPVFYARSTEVCSSSYDEARAFFQRFHLQGHRSSSFYLGLKAQDEWVALAAFLKKSDGWELTRYATSGRVPGGFSKILKHFRADHAGPITTFADLCISTGALYEKTGFRRSGTIPPDYSYLVDGERKHKFNYRKARFQSDPDLFWDPDMTETQLAKANGLHRIWDAGKLKYTFD